MGDRETSYPGWTHLQAKLNEAANAGESVQLSAVEVMVVLGETQRLHSRLEQARRVLGRVKDGVRCWHAEQGYAACEHPGVQRFLDEEPKRRRWWRRGRA